MPLVLTVEDRRLARNVAWSLFGFLAPVAVALFAIPVLIREVGSDRFGLLALAWTLVGFCSLFELGLGRALTRLVAQDLATENGPPVARTIWTALVFLLGMGVVGGLLLAALAYPMCRLIQIPAELVPETVTGFRVVAIAIPAVTLTAGLRGILEARQSFRGLSVLACLVGISIYGGPLLVVRHTHSLAAMLGTLALARFLSALGHLYLCLRRPRRILDDRKIDLSSISPLLRFGGWLTLGSLFGPILLSMDRFLIATLMSVSHVAFYVSPFEVVAKLLIIPGAVGTVIFPALSLGITKGTQEVKRIFWRGTLIILALILPATVLVACLARPGLAWWLGPQFAEKSFMVVRYFAVGVLLNSLAYVPLGYVQAAGRPDLTAKLQGLELPVFFGISWVLILAAGIEGAAIAWALRVGFETVVLFGQSYYLLRSRRPPAPAAGP